jgi:hypothetical protein
VSVGLHLRQFFLQFIVRGGSPSIIVLLLRGLFDRSDAPAAEPLGFLLARLLRNVFQPLTIHANGVSTITITHSAALLR